MSIKSASSSREDLNCYSVHVCEENCDKHEYLEPIKSLQSDSEPIRCQNIYYEIDLPRSSDCSSSDDVFSPTLPYDVKAPPTLPPRPMMTSQSTRGNSYYPDEVMLKFFERQSVSKDLLLRNCE